MLKIEKETHERFMRYKAKLHGDTGTDRKVDDVVNFLLDAVGAPPSTGNTSS